MRILIIDDDPQLLRLAVFALERAEMHVTPCDDAAEGLARAVAETFDAVILDLVMPAIDGHTVLESLRAHDATSALPVIILSASSDAAVLDSVRKLGVRAVIRKPFDPSRFAEQVSAALGTSLRSGDVEIPAAMRTAYLRSLAEQIEALQHAVTRWERGEGDPEPVRAAFHLFHKISGAAGTYALPSLGGLAQQGEALCGAWLNGERDPGAVARCLEIVRSMRESVIAATAADFNDETMRGPIRRVVHVLCVGDAPLHALAADTAFDLAFAADAEQALAAATRAMPDIVVLAGERAADTVAAIRCIPRGGNATILLVPSRPMTAADASTAVAGNADLALPPPVRAEELIGTVRQFAWQRFGRAPRVLSVGLHGLAEPLGIVIESVGCKVAVAPDFESVLSEVTAFDPDLVIAGVGNDAADALDFVRRLRLSASLPVVLVARSDANGLAVDAARAGVSDLLRLPISRALLLSVITARIESSRAQHYKAQRDALTGCWNAAEFVRRAHRRLENPSATGPSALALIELASPNDRRVVAVAALLRSRLRDIDAIGRMNASRFVLLLDRIDAAKAREIVQRLLRDSPAGPVRFAVFEANGHSVEHLLARAGEMLKPDSNRNEAVSQPREESFIP